jgi:hypothetical protein
VRLSDITPAHRAMLASLSRHISRRLDAIFTDPQIPDGTNAAISLHERGKRVTMEVPDALVINATTDAVARESFRVRIKARRDRMLFRDPPAPLPKRIERVEQPGYFRSGRDGRGSTPPRGRR